MRLWTRGRTPKVEPTTPGGRALSALAEAVLAGAPLAPELESDLARAIPRPGLVEQNLADIHLVAGDRETALRHATRSLDEGYVDVVWFESCPLLADVRDVPAWKALHERALDRAAPTREALSRTGLL
jgi:hypothetical protein